MLKRLVKPMKNKKILLYYLLEFILTICVFITILLLIIKITILNKNNILKIIDNNNYYHELYLDINNDFENYIMQSGFDIKIVDNLFTKDDLQKIIHKNVDNFYKGESILINTDIVKEKLDDNINNYLESNNIKITDEKALNLFKDEIIKIYKERIIINDKLIKLSNYFNQINKLINIAFIVLVIIDIILYLIIKFIFKKITLSIPVLTSMFLLMFGYFLIIEKININNIVFWNNYVSKVIIDILLNIKNTTKYVIIIGVGLEILKLLIILFRKSRKI